MSSREDPTDTAERAAVDQRSSEAQSPSPLTSTAHSAHRSDGKESTAMEKREEERENPSSALITRNEPRSITPSRSPAPVNGALIPLNSITRRVAIGIGKAGISIADGFLLSSSAILNPVVSASLVVYESVKAVQEYRHGDLNTLGYRTTKGDVALRIGKELTTMGIGMAIGQGIGALIGLSAIPVAGQLAVATVLSVGLGICVGALLTHYVDRFMTRLQLRNQYGYPMDERGSRRRFETLLERRNDLSTMETCRVVQHYADYRVASGWESANDLDDYRASGDITRLPISLQHFAVVQLQRRWGFVKERAQCRQIYRALLLVHHPDRGGSTALTAQLNKDFEFFAFCQGWNSDCVALLCNSQGGEATAAAASAGGPARRQRGNIVVDYLRTLFRPATNSHVGANDLHQFGLLVLEAGTPADMHRRDVSGVLPSSNPLPGAPGTAADVADGEVPRSTPGLLDIDSGSDEDEYEDSPAAAVIRQRSVTRLLRTIHEAYTATAEIITFSGLIQVSNDAERWAELHRDVSMFQRLQYYVSVHAGLETGLPKTEASDGAQASSQHRHLDPQGLKQSRVYHGFRWSSVEEAVVKREEVRKTIVKAVFTQETSQQLTLLLEQWHTAKAVAESYFRVCQQREADGRPPTNRNEDEGRQTLDALLRIYKQIEEAGAAARAPWQYRMEEWATRTVPGFSSFMEDVKEVGLTASNALAAEYASYRYPSLQQRCTEYFQAWRRKQNTLHTLIRELRLEYAALSHAVSGDGEDGTATTSTAEVASEPTVMCDAEVGRRIEDYQTQLLLLHKHMAEVDVGVAEWLNTCVAHFPEYAATLRVLPSTSLLGATEKKKTKGEDGPSGADASTLQIPTTVRFAHFERERTLLHYTRVEPEPVNPFDPFASCFTSNDGGRAEEAMEWESLMARQNDSLGGSCSLLRSFDMNDAIPDTVVGRHGVGNTLLQALYDDPLSGEITPCWLKRYSFAGAQEKLTEQDLLDVSQRILAEELAVPSRCCSDRVVAAHDVFCNYERREIFVHYIRGATQQRFRSANDVRRQAEPLGVQWLHDALECVVCLHSCQLAHGHIRLSSFTYDDFGNTSLGFFYPMWEPLNAATPPPNASPSPTLAERQYCDVVDVSIMILSELMPILSTGRRAPFSTPPPATPISTSSPTLDQSLPGCGPDNAAAEVEDLIRIMEAVAVHLVGKEEPRWSLLDARQFVRRFQQFRSYDAAIFTKQVAYPASWATQRAPPPVQLVAVDPAPFHLPLSAKASVGVRVYQNRHLSLWETYWRCRRKMATLHHGNYMLPSAVARSSPLLLCTDDWEVRERYVWCACASEEEAWERCQNGFRSLRRDVTGPAPSRDMAEFSLCAPSMPAGSGPVWGVVCRAALGTTVEETAEEFAVSEGGADPTTAQYNKLSYAAQRRSHFVRNTKASPDVAAGDSVAIWVPCPWARCYPEYVVHTPAF